VTFLFLIVVSDIGCFVVEKIVDTATVVVGFVAVVVAFVVVAAFVVVVVVGRSVEIFGNVDATVVCFVVIVMTGIIGATLVRLLTLVTGGTASVMGGTASGIFVELARTTRQLFTKMSWE